MRYTSLLLTATVLLLPLCTAALATLPNPAEGFNDLSWGQDITGIQELHKFKAKGNADFYVRDSEPYELYGQRVPRVVYGAKDGELFAVWVHTDDAAIFAQLQQDLSTLFGEPLRKQADGVDILQWEQEPFRIKLKADRKTGALKLGYYYMPVAAGVNFSIIDMVMDEIYTQELETFWTEGRPLPKAQ